MFPGKDRSSKWTDLSEVGCVVECVCVCEKGVGVAHSPATAAGRNGGAVPEDVIRKKRPLSLVKNVLPQTIK